MIDPHTTNATHLINFLEPPQLSVQAYQLEMIRGPEIGRVWELGDKVRVGKGPENDIIIVDATVSRNHFSLDRRPEGYLLRDLGSTNGTFLENARVVEAYIRPGMEIRAGEVLLKLKPVNTGVSISPSGNFKYGALVGCSAAMRRIFSLLEKVASNDATILIFGETGTGKGAIAQVIHEQSQRAAQPFVIIDCGAISRSLIESELFGHEKGAFTGASHQRKGALETANHGTIFIDELDDLPIDVQPKLLRALDTREISRVGSNKVINLDFRVVAATKKDLRLEVAEGRFREDLYYRLSVVTVPLPPLRERLEDLPLLAAHFLKDEKAWDKLPTNLREHLNSHSYPGNIREFRNLLERATYLEGSEIIDVLNSSSSATLKTHNEDNDFSGAVDYLKPFKEAKESVVDRFEKEYLRRLLSRNSGKVSRAAREAQIDRKHLYTLLSKHGLSSDD